MKLPITWAHVVESVTNVTDAGMNGIPIETSCAESFIERLCLAAVTKAADVSAAVRHCTAVRCWHNVAISIVAIADGQMGLIGSLVECGGDSDSG